MRKRTRTFLFIIFVALFLISVPLVVFYAQGYRWDFEQNNFVKTGALSIGAQPHPTEIFVQGDAEGSTNILFPNIFIPYLIPQDYSLEIRKQGYHTWNKILFVKQGEVTESLNVRLYPEVPAQEQVTRDVQAFFPQDEGRAALLVAHDEALRSQGLSLILFQPGTNDRMNLGPVQSPEEIKRIVWTDDAKNFFLLRDNRGNIRFEIGTTRAPYTLSSITLLPPALRKRAVLPTARFMIAKDASFLYIALSNPKSMREFQEIFRIDLISKKLEGPFAKNIHAITLHDNSIYALEDGLRMLVRYNADFTVREELTSEGIAKEECELFYEKGYIFALCRGDLLIFEEETGAFRMLAPGVKFFRVAPDGMKLAITKTNEVFLYWLEESIRSPRHKKGDTELVLRLSRPVDEVLWLQPPYTYLGVVSNDTLRIVELDFRDGLNIAPYTGIEAPIVWLAKQEAILTLREGNLLKIFLK